MAAAVTGPGPAGSGPWIATAYGPPWDAINGSGITATGLNLTAGPPAYEIAVDPSVIALQSFVHVSPNPFGTDRAFYAGDTGGAWWDSATHRGYRPGPSRYRAGVCPSWYVFSIGSPTALPHSVQLPS